MLGIDPARLEFFNLSAAQGPRWAEICTDFTRKIGEMGPSPIWLALRKMKKQMEIQDVSAEKPGGGTTVLTEEGVEKL